MDSRLIAENILFSRKKLVNCFDCRIFAKAFYGDFRKAQNFVLKIFNTENGPSVGDNNEIEVRMQREFKIEAAAGRGKAH